METFFAIVLILIGAVIGVVIGHLIMWVIYKILDR